jgi:hypothetical protein
MGASHLDGQELGDAWVGLSFQIASPAKALCDRLVLSRALPPLPRGAIRQWLLENLRLKPELLSEASLADLRAYLATGDKRRQVGTLLAVIELPQRGGGALCLSNQTTNHERHRSNDEPDAPLPRKLEGGAGGEGAVVRGGERGDQSNHNPGW